MKQKILFSLLPLILLLAFPVVALAQTYYQPLTITNSGSTDYTQVPLNFTINNTALVNNLYITSSGLDTRVTSSGTTLPHMLTNNQVYFVMPGINHGISTNAHYTMGNDPLDSFYLIPGYGGNVTVPITEWIDPIWLNQFTVALNGYINMNAINANIVYTQNNHFIMTVNSNNTLSVTINLDSSPTTSFTLNATNILSGIHSINVTSDGSTAILSIDGNQMDSHPIGVTSSYNSTAYNPSWRFMSNNTMPYATNIQVLNTISPDQCVNGTATASSTYVGYSPSNAFDNNGSTFWTSASGANLPQWICYNFGTYKRITAVSFSSRDDGQIKDFSIQASNDTIAWTTLLSATAANNANKQTWLFTNEGYYQYYRLYVTSKWRGNFCQVFEMALYTSTTPAIPIFDFVPPNNIINGANLPSTTTYYGNHYNGTINFGTNPPDISIATGSLIPFQTPEISAEDQEEVVFTPLTNPPSTPSGWIRDENTTQYNVIPGSEALNELAGVGGIPLRLFWVPVMFILAIFLGFTLYAKTKHLLASAIASGILLIFFAAIGMLDVWVLLIYGVIATALCVSEQVYGW